jgi:hypothetical protein
LRQILGRSRGHTKKSSEKQAETHKFYRRLGLLHL